MKKVKKLYKDWYNKIKQQHLTEKRNPQYTYAFDWTFDVYIKDIPCSIFVSEKTGVLIIINYHKHKKNNTLENCIVYNSHNDLFLQGRQILEELNIDYNNLTEEEMFQLSTIFDVYFYKTIKNIGRELHRTKNLNCNKLVAVLNKYK